MCPLIINSFAHSSTRIGLPFQAPTLCTVRLARKAFPGFKSYSLGNICQSLGIPLSNRHRALGDAEATAVLFHQSLEKLSEKEWSKLIHKGSNLDIWPPNLPPELLRKLPHGPGVYYMKDERGQVLYVGKAIDVKKRLAQHFSEALRASAKNAWWRRVFDVEFLQTGTEWMAFMVERLEIKRLWPEFNRAQKQPSFKYGLVSYTNASGERMLAIDKLRKGLKPLASFHRRNGGA
jgi:DNA polymerase-3 subunit epsilon